MMVNKFFGGNEFDKRDDMVYKYEPNQCGNCHEYLNDNDKYCRYCGTKRGEGKFLPYLNIMECIYGPMPEKRIHICESCYYQWETESMIDKQNFCPMCGSATPIVQDAWVSPHIRLQIIVDEQSIPIMKFPFIIGRNPDVDYCDPHPTVSRRHVELLKEHHMVFVVDCGSTNGSFLNKKRLVPLKKTPIVSGDSIKIGYSERIYKVQIDVN